MDLINNDVLVLILEHCISYKAFLNLRSVCKRWDALIRYLSPKYIKILANNGILYWHKQNYFSSVSNHGSDIFMISRRNTNLTAMKFDKYFGKSWVDESIYEDRLMDEYHVAWIKTIKPYYDYISPYMDIWIRITYLDKYPEQNRCKITDNTPSNHRRYLYHFHDENNICTSCVIENAYLRNSNVPYYTYAAETDYHLW